MKLPLILVLLLFALTGCSEREVKQPTKAEQPIQLEPTALVGFDALCIFDNKPQLNDHAFVSGKAFMCHADGGENWLGRPPIGIVYEDNERANIKPNRGNWSAHIIAHVTLK